MADNIIKLKVDSQEYEGKIKRASQGLQELGRNLREAGKTFADADAKQVEFARELGKMQTVSNTARGKIAEMSAAFVNLKSQYLKMTDAEKQSPIGQAMSKSLEELKNRTIDAKRELEDLNKELNTMKTTETSSGSGGGGLFSGDKLSGMLQVMGGNLMTKGVTMAAGAVTSMVNEIGDAVKQGVELAKQGEGIRIAFERLGRGDILDGLREATHGTVTDLELMKAAVKFNDFKLPVEELGTMLAFAQQKAKDTGQSVDYMVDSIVTGLGRKSLMILDNLGLSATEVKEKMKETGDMTKAVGDIIREQMAKAGDYVETAADRAAQANVSLQNKMEELGRKFAPVEEASSQLWTSMKIGILDIIGGPLATLINQLTEAGRLKNMLNSMNGESGSGNTKVDQQLKKLKVIKAGGGSDYIFNTILGGMIEGYNRQIMAIDAQIKNGGKPVGGGSGSSQDIRYLQRQMEALKIMRDQLQSGAKDILNPAAAMSSAITGGDKSGKGGSGSKSTSTPKSFFDMIDKVNLGADALKGSDVPNMMSVWASMTDEAKKSMLGLAKATEDLGDAQAKLGESKVIDEMNERIRVQAAEVQKTKKAWTDAAQAVGLVGNVMSSIKDPAAQTAGAVAQAIANIALAYSQALGEDGSIKSNIWYFIAASAAAMTSMVTTISQIHSSTGYAQGGIVKGNSYSGDNVPAMVDGSQMVGLNAGEVVLTRAMQSNLANTLEGGGMRTLHVVGKISGTDIILSVDRSLRLQGKELAVWGRG